MSTRPFCTLPALACFLLAGPVAAGELASAAGRVLDVTPERLQAFRTTLREFGARLTAEEVQAAGMDLAFTDVYESPFLDHEDEWPLEQDAGPLGPMARDVIAEEEFLIENRQEDFEDAAKKWLSRRLKGSRPSLSEGSPRFATKFGWNDGPVVGVRKGPLSATVGEWGWQLRWTRRLKAHPGWVARVSAGVDDGEEKIAFTVGRSLLRSAER